MALACILFQALHSEWVAFGIYILLVVMICNVMDWKAASSVNAVIGTHFLTEKNFTYEFIGNEFLLVVTGITVAIVLNLFHGNRNQKNRMIQSMHKAESDLQMILGELAAYLNHRSMQRNVWEDIRIQEENLHQCVAMAYEYQGNTANTKSFRDMTPVYNFLTKLKIQTRVLYRIIKAINKNYTKRDEFVSTAYYT